MTARGTPFTPRRTALKMERDHLAQQLSRMRTVREEMAPPTARGTRSAESEATTLLMKERMQNRQAMEDMMREHEAVQRDALELRQRLDSSMQDLEEVREREELLLGELSGVKISMEDMKRERDNARAQSKKLAEDCLVVNLLATSQESRVR